MTNQTRYLHNHRRSLDSTLHRSDVDDLCGLSPLQIVERLEAGELQCETVIDHVCTYMDWQREHYEIVVERDFKLIEGYHYECL